MMSDKNYILFATTLSIILISTLLILISAFVRSEHLYPISNYAIAITLGMASVIFSWCRAEENKELILTLKITGKFSLISAICFMLASISDYASIKALSWNNLFMWLVGTAFRGAYVLTLGAGVWAFVRAVQKTIVAITWNWEESDTRD